MEGAPQASAPWGAGALRIVGGRAPGSVLTCSLSPSGRPDLPSQTLREGKAVLLAGLGPPGSACYLACRASG